ncbi:hypothetical protein HOD08_03175, partial [bacterium]|nr:hypothetical protein [bacterium]
RMYQQGVPLSQHVIQFAGVNPYMMGAGMTPMMNTGMTTGIGTGMVTPVVDSVGVPIAHTTMMSGVMPGVMPGMMGPAPQKPEGAGAVSLIGGEASLNKQRQNEALKRLRGDPFKAVEGDMKQATRFMGGSTEEKQGLYVQSLAAFREFIRDLKFKIKVQKKIDEGMKTRIENFYEDAKGRIAESWMSPNPMTWDEDSVREAYVKAFSELRRTVVFQHLSDEIQKKMVESIDDVERHSKFFMASNFMSYLADLTAKINNRIGFMGAPGTKRERKAQFQIGVEALSKELREDRPYLTDIQAFDRVCELIETSKERMGWSALNPLGWKNEQLYGSVYRLFEAAKKHDKFWKMLKEKNPELKEMIDEFKPLAKEESEGHHADFFVLKDYAFGKAKDKMFTDTGISSFEFQRKKTDQLNYYESHKGQIENIKTMVFAATDNSKNDEEQQRIFRNGLIELEKEIKLNGELMDNRVIASVKAMLTKAADMLDWRYEVGGEWEDQVLYQAFSRALTAIKDNKSLSKKFMGTREMELLDEALEKAGSTKSILKQDIQRQRDMGPELRREF